MALAMTPPGAQAATALYPDLRTLPPTDLRFDTVSTEDGTGIVLRFSNSVWNAGQGPLELHGDPNGDASIIQRVYDDGGGFADYGVNSDFVFHPDHDHFHFADFAEYQLWTDRAYKRWAAGRPGRQELPLTSAKTTFCVMDTGLFEALAETPPQGFYNECGTSVQGLSVGWRDTYGWWLPDQWIELGDTALPNGNYVLRSVADPLNRVYESVGAADAAREDPDANEAISHFSVKQGAIIEG